MSNGIAAAVEQLGEEIGALIAEHAGRRSLDNYTRYADDPLGFMRDVLGITTLWDRQEQIGLSVRDNPRTCAVGCNAAGKDWFAARLALWWVYARRGYVLVTGPSERQVREVCMGHVRRAFAAAPDLPGKLFDMALRLPGSEETGILAYTSNNASRSTGYHAPKLLVIVTEAQGLEPWAFEAVYANATSAESRVLLLGNPLFRSGKFAEAAKSPHYHTVTMPATLHPNVLGTEVIPGAITRQGVEQMAQEFGVDSSIYRSRILAEFPQDDVEALFQWSWFEQAALRHDKAMQKPIERIDAVAALDPSRLGADASVLAVRRGSTVLPLVEWRRCTTMESAGMVQRQLLALGVPLDPPGLVSAVGPGFCTAELAVDEIGIGAGILDRLRELKLSAVGFNGGRTPESTAEQLRFANQRASSYWRLRDLLEQGVVALPRDPKLFEELAATPWKTVQGGKIQIEDKGVIKAVLGRSPDRADAVTMCTRNIGRLANWRLTPVRYV